MIKQSIPFVLPAVFGASLLLGMLYAVTVGAGVAHAIVLWLIGLSGGLTIPSILVTLSNYLRQMPRIEMPEENNQTTMGWRDRNSFVAPNEPRSDVFDF